VNEQAMAALDRANAVRVARAELKRSIGSLSPRAAAARLTEILEDPDDVARRMSVGTLLSSAKLIGPSKIAVLLRHAAIVSPDRRVGELTERQRRGLILALDSRHLADARTAA
jgi:hypothetical protein